LQDEDTMNKNIVKFRTSVESAWQHLADVHLEGRRSLKNKPIVLVFTKCDLFLYLEKEMTFGEHVSKKVQRYGFDEISDIEKIDEEKLKHGKNLVKKCFGDVIKFLDARSHNCSVIYTSSFWLVNDSNN